MTNPPNTQDAPEIPQQISGDGREIWDWAGKFSAHVHKQDNIRKLSQRIRDLGATCGDCSLWMTTACPKEVHSNTTGRSSGPHMNLLKCVKFIETSRTTKLRAELSEELKKVENHG